MQAVPSLVGTGTAVAAAATGLVVGQSIESNLPASSRPPSPFARLPFSDFRIDDSRATPTPPLTSRPGTESSLRLSQTADGPSFCHDQPHPSPLFSHPIGSARRPPTSSKPFTSSKPPSSRRQSYIRSGDVAAANAAEGARDSVSSHGSWMRRLSLRPPSQHENSPRSSLGPDSSFSYSQGSGAPMFSPTASTSSSTYPNKLIKRMGTTRDSIFARRGSKGQVPTLRRPATSHQRSATALDVPLTPALHLPSEESQKSPRPRASTVGQTSMPWRSEDPSIWVSFFHLRRVKTLRRRIPTASNEGSPADKFLLGMRIQPRRGDQSTPYLVHPSLISGEVFEVAVADSVLEQTVTTEASAPSEPSPHTDGRQSLDQSNDTPTRKARRSFSTQFGPSSGWKARAGSLRRQKRTSEEHNANRRYASDPTSSTSPNSAQTDSVRSGMEELFTPPKSGYRNSRVADIFATQDRARDCPSPIRSTSRLSNLQVDMSRIGPSPPSSAGLYASPVQLSPTSAPFGASLPSHSRAVSKEGAVTLAGSEMSVPGLASGDDDTDYKSDALFDSFRTTDTDNFRMAETPLDTMFDDSYQGAPGQFKTKRLSIQEILGNSWDGDTRIMEEDEGSATPMRGLRDPRITGHMHGDDRATEIAKYQLSMGDRERTMGRLSLDTTDDDYDWARDDDDGLSHPLSPPTSSLNSRRGMSPPPLRSALASISGNSPSDSYTIASPLERPRSNLFDWAEPSHEASNSTLSRPKTARGQTDQDNRGGRIGGRKGFPAVHVRSQSVPVVPDPQDVATGAPKFGTWAVGNMNTSEDWDDDFDFEEASNAGSAAGARPAKSLSMRVPQPIQATQSTVKAHSGQIRELSLLVSSLKRLFRQGRELKLLDGQAATLWKEAENIIELASPDEDEEEVSDTDRSFSDFDPSTIDERFLDEGFDAAALDGSDVSVDGSQSDILKNAVVKERTVVRRRSVFSPDDDIFGNNLTLEVADTRPHTPRTPDRVREFHTTEGAVVSSVIAAMEQQRARSGRQESPLRPSKAKLFFDTNSLQELVKRAATVFHALSEIVRREELLTMSPQSTPRHDRQRRGGSPAFTRVFSDPDAGSPRHLVKSQKSHSSMPRKSLDSNGLGQRMHMMTVS